MSLTVILRCKILSAEGYPYLKRSLSISLGSFVHDSKFSFYRELSIIGHKVMHLVVFLFKYIRQVFLEGIGTSLVVLMPFFAFRLVFVMIVDGFGID